MSQTITITSPTLTQTITPVSVGIQGPAGAQGLDGEGATTLTPRVEALEAPFSTLPELP